MAAIRQRKRKDGTWAYAVLYTLDGEQTSVTFDTRKAAEEFRNAVNSLGAERAMRAWDITRTKRTAVRIKGPTVAEYLDAYIDGLTGKTKATLWDYRNYLKNDIAPVLGPVPLADLSSDDISGWIKAMETKGRKTKNGKWAPVAGKTIANKHGFLSGALNAATKRRPPLIPYNPAAGVGLPKTVAGDKVFLSQRDYDRILAEIPAYWKPLVEFLYASGCRWSEATYLRPEDIDRESGMVRIRQAWKRTYDPDEPYEAGTPKTKRSDRTIAVSKRVLELLDYSGHWVFTGHTGKPVRAASFRENVWKPAIKRAGIKTQPRLHDLRHTHASKLIQAGKSLPVISRRMGHNSIKVTVDVYGHLERADDVDAAEVFD